MTNATYYDQVKAKVSIRHGRFEWEMRDVDDQILAAGEEYTFKNAVQEATAAVVGLRLWSTFSRGNHQPNPNGSRSFYYKYREPRY